MVNYHKLYFKLLFEHHRTYLKPYHKLISCLTIMYEFRKTGGFFSKVHREVKVKFHHFFQ